MITNHRMLMTSLKKVRRTHLLVCRPNWDVTWWPGFPPRRCPIILSQCSVRLTKRRGIVVHEFPAWSQSDRFKTDCPMFFPRNAAYLGVEVLGFRGAAIAFQFFRN